MPSKQSKMTGKNQDEKETPFDPVPYETANICTSITLLSSPEKDVVIRALWILSKYADAKDNNVEFLYIHGIISPLFNLIGTSDLIVLRFSLKLLGQLAMLVPAAAKELAFEDNHAQIQNINHIFMNNKDEFVKEFSTQILSRTVKGPIMTSYVLKSGVVITIFNVLQKAEDPDIQLNTLTYFKSVLEASEAVFVLPQIPEFSARIILCFLNHQIREIREAALDIVEKLTSWKSKEVQELFQYAKIMETLLKLIMNPELHKMHKQTFSVIYTCMECSETASYFAKTLEFIEFCHFAKQCTKKYILPGAVIISSLTKLVELRQTFFDFSVEDTILSFFRINNETVFYKTCVAITNMSSHRYCCEKMLTPVVMNCLLEMLNRTEIPIIPYHEIALKTIYNFMKRELRTRNIIVNCGGVECLMKCWLKDQKEYTTEGYSNLMDMLYIFSTDPEYRLLVMNLTIYEMLINTLDISNYFFHHALLVLNQYVDNGECRQYFLDLDGPNIVLQQITSTPSEETIRELLIFLRRMFLYKRIGMAFLKADSLQILDAICTEVKEAVPLINDVIMMMYDLYLPIKFHYVQRLEMTDHLNTRFHLIKGKWNADFPFLEIIDKQEACPISIIYVVDFSGDSTELTKKTIKIPLNSSGRLESTLSLANKNSSRSRLTSILKSNLVNKMHKHSTAGSILSEMGEPGIFLTCQVPPPINFGSITEDPYLPQYVQKLKKLIYKNKKYIMCFQHQVKLIARFIHDMLSGPEGIEFGKNSHCLEIHLKTLREKLGTNIIPIGYLRCGDLCERALIFKAVAEKVGVPASLVKGRNENFYWNEVPIANEEPYVNVNDEQKTYMGYAVVDLIDKIGELMLVGSLEANKYCGLQDDADEINETNAMEIQSKLDLNDINM